MARVLVVDDEASIRIVNRALLRGLGYVVETAENGIEALDVLANQQYDLVITDMNMPFMDGATLIERMARDHPDTPIVVISGEVESYKRRFIDHPQVRGYMRKPFGFARLSEMVGDVAPTY